MRANESAGYFQKKGYFDVTADSRMDRQENIVNVVYEISLGDEA